MTIVDDKMTYRKWVNDLLEIDPAKINRAGWRFIDQRFQSGYSIADTVEAFRVHTDILVHS